MLKQFVQDQLIYGLGISYRKDFPFKVPDWIVDYDNTIMHVITGIDTIDDVLSTPFKKVLVLGYKRFGFGIDYYCDQVEQNLKTWRWWVSKLFSKQSLSFDNLALEQLNMRRFFPDDVWETFYQGEHSFYIDAVNQTFSPSSRSSKKISWDNMSIREYFLDRNLDT